MDRYKQAKEELNSLIEKSNISTTRTKYNSSRTTPYCRTPNSRVRSPPNEKESLCFNNTQNKILALMNTINPNKASTARIRTREEGK